MTPKIAWDKFDIEWKDNDIPKDAISVHLAFYRGRAEQLYQGSKGSRSWIFFKKGYFYPTVVISYMGPEVGYGLFAIDDIAKGYIITDYAGRHIREEKDFQDNDYVISAGTFWTMNMIDAKDIGNAGRFAQGFFGPDSCRSMFGNRKADKLRKIFSKHKNSLVTSNAEIALYISNKQFMGALLYATTEIKAFEQILLNYSSMYWKGWHQRNKGEQIPHLFDKDGNVLSFSSGDILERDLEQANGFSDELWLFMRCYWYVKGSKDDYFCL